MNFIRNIKFKMGKWLLECFHNEIIKFPLCIYNIKQDACTGVHSACRQEENGHNLDIWVLRLRQGQMQIFLCFKVGKGLDFQKWNLNREHETERTVFPIPQVFGMCRRRL